MLLTLQQSSKRRVQLVIGIDASGRDSHDGGGMQQDH